MMLIMCRGPNVMFLPQSVLAERVAMLLQYGFSLANVAKMVEQHPLVCSRSRSS